MKKILIVKPIVDDSDPSITHYTYPDSYIAQHASHICYNFADSKILKGSHISEGMVIYTAKSEEFKKLLKEPGISEISFLDADLIGKKWKPARIRDGTNIPAFSISNFISKSDINS